MISLPMTRRAASLVLAACLAACGGGGGGDGGVGTAPGGGDGGGSGGGGNGGGGGSGGGAPAQQVTGQYAMQPAASGSAALAAFNDQGSRGYAFIGTQSTGGGSAGTDFYVTDTAHSGSRLAYEFVAQANSGDALVAQLNQQGARGFAFKAPYLSDASGIRLLTVRDTTRSVTYSYERQPISGSLGSDAFQAQLNAEGARGYRLVGPFGAGSDSFNLYVKDSSATTYAYTVIPISGSGGMASGDALRQRLNEQGAQGRFYLGAFVLQGQASAQVFEKSSAQNGPIDYDLAAVSLQASAGQKLAAMNQLAAQGLFFVSDLTTDDGSAYTLSARNAASLRSPLAGIAFPN